ncbi:MAG: M67 family metallopeptidase [Lachnospiraceae bacterium]|nr:M67 family metallopeptidase [Lachnospiraceae bacterium]
MIGSLNLQKDIFLQICVHASQVYPQECCGILLGDGKKLRVQEIYKAQNKSVGEPGREHFLIDPLELYQAERKADEKGLDVIGFYHSHPDCLALLSREDEEYMIPGMIYFIISLTDGKIAEWKIYRKTKPDERAFELNTDC